MQKQQTTGLRTAAKDYVTLVQQACNKVTGFSELYKEMARSINISGKSQSTLINYSRQLAHLALHYDCFPLDLDAEQVMDYLHLVKSRGSVSATFFKFTVYGLRYACKMRGLEYKQFSLPEIERTEKLPVVLNGSEVKALLSACQGRKVYDILFQTAWSVLSSFGHDPKWLGAQPGMIAIMHTWGQTMSLHPHLHCIVPGGGLTPQGKWKVAKSQGKYLFPVKAMGKVFRARFIEALKEALPGNISYELVRELYKNDWVVYAKRPFNGPQTVIEYLGRYTHKIAISNHRIKHISEDKVTFSYKDYRQSAATKEMTLDALEFIRRFAMHILPKGFVRVRHYGILSSTAKAKCAIQIKEQLPDIPKPISTRPVREPYNPKKCPRCKKETMLTILRFNRRGPPRDWELLANKILDCLH